MFTLADVEASVQAEVVALRPQRVAGAGLAQARTSWQTC